MAFKNTRPQNSVPDSPDELLLDLPRRKIPNVLPHQREVMRAYASRFVDHKDVAMQLPTGSGKTLVGLLTAEWRRRRFQERVVYLCPTVQLVHQAVEQGEDKYGLTALAFSGPKRDYAPASKAAYQSASSLAVTTYSSLFNVRPFFENPDIVIVDDAHAAENYVAGMWSLRISRLKEEHSAVHQALSNVLRPHVDPLTYARMTGDESEDADWAWVEKLPAPILLDVQDALTSVLDAHAEQPDVRYVWSLLRDRLHACNLFIANTEILVRPLIAPTWTHSPFHSAKQRIYMSATLGAGGDLERLMGRRHIDRIDTPQGWDRHGVGRRLFIFPAMSLDNEEVGVLRLAAMKRAGRSLTLVPSDVAAARVKEEVTKELGFPTFDAEAIESSKAPFVASPQAVAIIANRYDGVDFPGDDCRLLVLDGMPTAVNLQERFIMSRMCANALYNERIQVRVLQAVGRCTRSLEDYSAVIIIGEALVDYLADHRRRKFFHPELQAEIIFGVEQSKGMDIDAFLENLNIFLRNGKEWEQVNQQILDERKRAVREPFPAIVELAAVVKHEIQYQEALWQGDFISAVEAADRILGGLEHESLRGYRALWNYLAGNACWLEAKAGNEPMRAKARQYFTEAKKAASGIPWLVALSRHVAEPEAAEHVVPEAQVAAQVEGLESELAKRGTLHDREFARLEKQILVGLVSKDKGPFEEAHRLLGQLLGLQSGNVETDGAPDPWWGVAGLWLVFEDNQGANASSPIGVEKARQAASHPKWLRHHLRLPESDDVAPVLVTPKTTIKKAAVPHLNGVSVWILEDFVAWAKAALSRVRHLRTSFVGVGDLTWRKQAIEALREDALDLRSIVHARRTSNMIDTLELVP